MKKATITLSVLAGLVIGTTSRQGIHSDQEAKSDFLKTIGFYTTPRQLQLDKDGIIQSAPSYKNEQLTLKNQNGNISSQRPLTSDNRKPWIDKSHNQNA
ncbi:MAG: hypothetical protein ACLR3O_01655 [Streptococcus sp.]